MRNINRDAYSKAYGSLAKIARKYYPVHRMNKFYEAYMIEDFRNAMNEFKEKMPDFPEFFYGATANTLVHWFLNDFKGVRGASAITTTLQGVWEFHKTYLFSDWSPDDREAAFDKASKVENGIDVPKELLRIYTIVVEDLVDALETSTEETDTAEARVSAKTATATTKPDQT